MKLFKSILAFVMAAALSLCLATTLLFYAMRQERVLKKVAEDANLYGDVTSQLRSALMEGYKNSSFYVPMLSNTIAALADEAIPEETVRSEIDAIIHRIVIDEDLMIDGQYFIDDYTSRIVKLLSQYNLTMISEASVRSLVSKAVSEVVDDLNKNLPLNDISRSYQRTKNRLWWVMIITAVISVIGIVLLLVFGRWYLAWGLLGSGIAHAALWFAMRYYVKVLYHFHNTLSQNYMRAAFDYLWLDGLYVSGILCAIGLVGIIVGVKNSHK